MKHGIDDNWLVCEECGEWHNPEHGIICDKCGNCVDLEWANARLNDAEERVAVLDSVLKDLQYLALGGVEEGLTTDELAATMLARISKAIE